MDAVRNPALERAIKAAGGISALARALNLKSHAVVQQWRLNRVPAEHCPAIELTTGVICEELRPDIPWGVLRKGADPANGDAPDAPQTPAGAEQGAA